MDEPNERTKALIQEYQALAHAMQTGVAHEMSMRTDKDTEPKHLRVGVNTALCDQSALVKLLVKKGVVTHEEVMESLVEEMRLEVKRYEKRLSAATGTKITLG